MIILYIIQWNWHVTNIQRGWTVELMLMDWVSEYNTWWIEETGSGSSQPVKVAAIPQATTYKKEIYIWSEVGGRREATVRGKAKGGEPDNRPCDYLNLTKRIIISTKINSLHENENIQFLNFFHWSADNIQHVSNFTNRNMHKQLLQQMRYTNDQSRKDSRDKPSDHLRQHRIQIFFLVLYMKINLCWYSSIL